MALSLFKKVQPVDDPIPERGGKFVLRQAISLRVEKRNLQTLVQTINAPQDSSSPSQGQDNLDETQLSAVANYIFGNATYSAELDRLVSTAKPPTSMGKAPPPYVPGVAPRNIHRRSHLGQKLRQRRHFRLGWSSSSKFKRPEGWA